MIFPSLIRRTARAAAAFQVFAIVTQSAPRRNEKRDFPLVMPFYTVYNYFVSAAALVFPFLPIARRPPLFCIKAGIRRTL